MNSRRAPADSGRLSQCTQEILLSWQGNNNGYCQDSEISWVHWDNLPESAEALREFTRQILTLRAQQPLLRRENWRDPSLW